LRRISAAISGVATIAVLLALLATFRFDEPRFHVAFTPRFHIGSFGGAAWFYSDPMPYRGSIVSLGLNGQEYSPIIRRTGLDFPGIYFRSFLFPSKSLWTLRVNLLYPILILGFTWLALCFGNRLRPRLNPLLLSSPRSPGLRLES
jgi:hypothetical protein